MYVCLSVTLHLPPMSFDAKKKIISALDSVIPCQEFSVQDFTIFV